MLFIGIIAWLTAFTLNYQNKADYIKWLSRFSFVAGCGAFANVLAKDIAPYVHGYISNNEIASRLIMALSGIFHSISYSGSPYTFLLFSMTYTGFYKFKSQRQLKFLYLILSIPVLIMFIRYPVFDLSYNAFFWLNIWSDPYATFGCILLLLSFLKEQNFKVKQQKFFVFITVTPTILFLMSTTYICPLLSLRDIYRFNLMIVVTDGMLFVFAFKYGFLGFKLSFQKSYIDTMRAISSGTSLINHAIKNETLKISICAENLKKFIHANLEAVEDINIINSSADHILNMMARIQEKTQEISICEQTINMSEVIENAIFTSKPLLEGKNIIIKKSYLMDVYIKIDKIHILYVLSNLIQNAVEAMNQNGELKICLSKTKNEVLVSLQDNGIGIPKENIAHVLEPFFSTKNRQLNYGLGLSYCYSVMQKHNGTIEILSEENKGTQVLLKFPWKRVEKLIQSEVSNG